MLERVDRSQINSSHPTQATAVSDNCYCAVTKTAIHAIRALGAILVAAGVGCIIAGLQAPAIALLVVGVAALILGFILDKSEEVQSVLQRETLEEIRDDLTLATPFGLDVGEQVNPVLQPEILEEIKEPIPAIAFGRQAWKRYIGDPGELPPLPADIDDILAQPCPFWGPEKKVAETHMLVLIPKTLIVGDNPAVPLTLRTFMELLQSSNKDVLTMDDFPGQRSYILEMHGDKPIEESHWILMTKEILPESGGKSYREQKQLIEEAGDYEVPSCLEAAIAILSEKERSGTCLFKRDFTRCRESFYTGEGFFKTFEGIIVGHYSPGLEIIDVPGNLDIGRTLGNVPAENDKSWGIAGVKKL